MLKRFLLTGIAIVLSLLLAANPAIADPSIPDTAVEEGWYLHPLGKPNAADHIPGVHGGQSKRRGNWIRITLRTGKIPFGWHTTWVPAGIVAVIISQCDEVGWQTGDGVYNSIAI